MRNKKPNFIYTLSGAVTGIALSLPIYLSVEANYVLYDYVKKSIDNGYRKSEIEMRLDEICSSNMRTSIGCMIATPGEKLAFFLNRYE